MTTNQARESKRPDFRRAAQKCYNLLILNTILSGARDRIRTGDLRITNALLYQLSYTGVTRTQEPSAVSLKFYPSRSARSGGGVGVVAGDEFDFVA